MKAYSSTTRRPISHAELRLPRPMAAAEISAAPHSLHEGRLPIGTRQRRPPSHILEKLDDRHFIEFEGTRMVAAKP